MQIVHLNHVALHVADLDAAKTFYEGVLNLQPLPRPAFSFPGAWYRLGGDQELHLIGERNREVVSHHRGDHFALMVDDIGAWESSFQAKGAAYQPRKIRPDGAYQIFLIDPDGHWIELCSRPGTAPSA